jgi:hypothetical protein
MRLIALIMEVARTSETLLNFYQTTWRYNPQDSQLRYFRLVSTFVGLYSTLPWIHRRRLRHLKYVLYFLFCNKNKRFSLGLLQQPSYTTRPRGTAMQNRSADRTPDARQASAHKPWDRGHNTVSISRPKLEAVWFSETFVSASLYDVTAQNNRIVMWRWLSSGMLRRVVW